MRWRILSFLVLACTAFAPAVGRAQTEERLVIEEGIRIGLPEGRRGEAGRYKAGCWTPVYFDLTIGPQEIPAGEAAVVVETADSDGIQNQFAQPLPLLPRRQTISGLITYVRPGNFGNEVTLSILLGGRVYKSKRIQPDYDSFVENGGVLYLTVGSRLPGMQRALSQRRNQPQQAGPDDKADDENFQEERYRRFAAIEQVEHMPLRWFGYQAVDVLVLTSGSENFLKRLLADRAGRLDALADWARRGGRLILTAGHNQQLVGELLSRMRLINCTIAGTVTRPRLLGFQALTPKRDRFEPAGGVEIAKLVPGPGVDLLTSELLEPANDRDTEARPLAVQAAFGLGRVVLIGVDLDTPPFTAWKGQGDIWRYLQDRLEPRRSESSVSGGNLPPNFSGRDTTELVGQMQTSLEHFDDITVISFGWVALFILLYIIVVGPLDYLFLKKVVKRLELTWITFPAMVLVISAAAYFTAYYLKGNDLKINKLDIVDIDLTPAVDANAPPPRVQGSTWFTLFSPRIQNYTIGLASAESWGASGQASTLLGWQARPENVFGGTGRAGSQSLFRRTYEINEDSSGLIGVPIQVWATKSFAASWVVPPTGSTVPFSAELKHAPANPQSIIGTITNRLPVDLMDVTLFYRGKAFPQGRMDAGMPLRINIGGQPGRGFKEWLRDPFTGTADLGASREGLPGWSASPELKSVLFFDQSDLNPGQRNTTLRHLDQSWRLTKERDEVILIGKVDGRGSDGTAEQVTADPSSPSQLWLGELPGPGKTRPALAGTMTQRSIVRVYIPVSPER